MLNRQKITLTRDQRGTQVEPKGEPETQGRREKVYIVVGGGWGRQYS